MPPGLDTLTSLQTLTRFVVGKDASGQGNIGELRDLSALVNLRGELSIICNDNSTFDVANYRQTELLRTAHLKQLTIQFRNQGAIHETLLACLRPYSKLIRFKIKSYEGLKLPSWAESLASSLPNLVKINLRKFDSLEILPPLSKLRHLKDLKLRGMPNVEFMENDMVVGPSDAELVFFPSLEELVLYDFPKLKWWWREEISSSSAIVPAFLSLRRLCLEQCPNLTTLPPCPSLCNLYVRRCHKELSLLENKGAVPGHPTRGSSPNLSSGIPLLYMESVETDNTGFLDSLFEKYQEGIHYLCIQNFEGESLWALAEKWVEQASSVKELEISACPKLKSLPGMGKHLTSLHHLHIRKCDNLELENNEEATSTTTSWRSLHLLSLLRFNYLPKLINLPKELQYLTSLQYLEIWDCGNLEALPEWIKYLTSLQTLRIRKCHKLKSLPEAIAHMPALETLVIHNCENLKRRCRQPDGEDWPKVAERWRSKE